MNYALCFPVKTKGTSITEVLLGFKKRGFGQGGWNGFGGKQELDEHIVDTTIRELFEESCLATKPDDLEYAGIVACRYLTRDVKESMEESNWLTISVSFVHDWGGSPTETEEMRPQWFSVNALPLYQLSNSLDVYWLEDLFKNKSVQLRFTFDTQDKLLGLSDYTNFKTLLF